MFYSEISESFFKKCIEFEYLTLIFKSSIYSIPTGGVPEGPEHLSLKVPNVKFDFDVSVDSIQLQTDTSKSNSMLK